MLLSINNVSYPDLRSALLIIVESSKKIEFESDIASCEKKPLTVEKPKSVTEISSSIESNKL